MGGGGELAPTDDLNTLGELDGFIESQQCDYTLIAGDFNVDFDRGGIDWQIAF